MIIRDLDPYRKSLVLEFAVHVTLLLAARRPRTSSNMFAMLS